jgi:hypothetical protein
MSGTASKLTDSDDHVEVDEIDAHLHERVDALLAVKLP